MAYTQIALCIVGMSLYFNAGRLEARGGGKDQSILWAALSLLTSLLSFSAGEGWFFWLVAQAALFFGIALVRVLLDRDWAHHFCRSGFSRDPQQSRLKPLLKKNKKTIQRSECPDSK